VSQRHGAPAPARQSAFFSRCPSSSYSSETSSSAHEIPKASWNATTPHLQTKKARVERPVTAQAALAATSRTAQSSRSTTSSSSSSSSSYATVNDRSIASKAAGPRQPAQEDHLTSAVQRFHEDTPRLAFGALHLGP